MYLFIKVLSWKCPVKFVWKTCMNPGAGKWTQVIGNRLKQSFDHLHLELHYTVITFVVEEATNWDEQFETTCPLLSLQPALFT